MIGVSLLGTGGTLPSSKRHLTALLINIGGKKVLVDCGEGTQISMKDLGWGFKDIDVICITHVHVDHILGLPGLLLTIANSGKTTEMKIIGPQGIIAVIESLRVLFPYLPYEIEITEISEECGHIDISPKFAITTLQVDHSIECLGYSFYFRREGKFDIKKATEEDVPMKIWKKLQNHEEVVLDDVKYDPNNFVGEERKGIKFSYITDSRPTDKMIQFISNSDLFICEGTYGDEEDGEKAIVNKHMTFSEAATLALKGNVDELWLTHFSPSMQNPEEYVSNAKNIFDNVVIPHDRQVKELKYSNDDGE